MHSEKIRSVTFESETALAGDFVFYMKNVTDKEEWTISGYTSKMVTTLLEKPAAIPDASGEAARVYLTIAPGQYAGQIVVKTDDAQYTFRLKNTMNFGRAMITGLPADLAKAKREIFSDDLIPFEDSEVKRICVENWDTNGDGNLSYKEAAAVTSIEDQFHTGRTLVVRNLKELRYFTGLKTIGGSAFSALSNLTSINLPDGLTTIGEYAFSDCNNLTSIHIPDGLTTIGGSAFEGCSSLTSINIPDGITTIGQRAFSGCSSLTSINLPDGVTRLGDRVFYGCSSLTSINILAKTLSTIGSQILGGCSSLSVIEGGYASADHRCLVWNGVLIGFARADLTKYTIPEGVTRIGFYVFRDCSDLTSINIPDAVTEIGKYVFRGCSNLTSITIPKTVTKIGASFENCSSLTSVYCKPTTPPTISGWAFDYTPSSMKIYVPAASVETYKTDYYWKGYASKIFAE